MNAANRRGAKRLRELGVVPPALARHIPSPDLPPRPPSWRQIPLSDDNRREIAELAVCLVERWPWPLANDLYLNRMRWAIRYLRLYGHSGETIVRVCDWAKARIQPRYPRIHPLWCLQRDRFPELVGQVPQS